MFENTAALVPDLDTAEPVSPDVVQEIEQDIGVDLYGCRPIKSGFSAALSLSPGLLSRLSPYSIDVVDGQLGGISLTDIANMAGVYTKPQPHHPEPAAMVVPPSPPIVPAYAPSPPTASAEDILAITKATNAANAANDANNSRCAAASSPGAGRRAGRAGKKSDRTPTVAKVKKILAGAAQKIAAKPAVPKADRAARVARLTVDDIAKTGILPADHKPARGRGRHLQLQTMSLEMIAAEAASRLAKNRDAARDSRLKRKNHVVVLEGQVEGLQSKLAEAEKHIAKLEAQVKRLGGR